MTDSPAFPFGESSGLTLRDYFAAKAMQSLIISMDVQPQKDDNDENIDAVAVSLYSFYFADEMMRTREME